MKPVRQGDRGPAVEDIQRRLRALGYDLGRAGIDGIFFGATAEAVRSFQRKNSLVEDGYVGDQTWSALVDATFTLGDRMLYLRVPHFHGRDVAELQRALNVLGFACGELDGIFGTFTERAVHEFQRNAGLRPDGIVGFETVKALDALRHVWEGKEPKSHSEARLAPARAAEALSRASFSVSGLDEVGERVAGRVVNLAIATSGESRASIIGAHSSPPPDVAYVFRIGAGGTARAVAGAHVTVTDLGSLRSRILAAVSAAPETSKELVVELDDSVIDDEREEQRAAVTLLDAVCALFERD